MDLKKQVVRIIVSFILLIVARLIPAEGVTELCLYLLPYAIIGFDVVKLAVMGIVKGQVFDENFLMTLATVGAFFTADYPEAVTVMLFYQVGETFNRYAVDRSRKSISALMEINPEYANVLRDGKELKVEPYEVLTDEIVLVKPGERIPLDGVIVKGNGSLDTSAMTGEAIPRDVVMGDEVISGCINLNSVLEVKVQKEYDDSTVAKIIELMETASNKKAKAENFITKFARYYTPIVVIVAALLAVLPPLILNQPFSEWVYRALSFLVISCPCALVISVPLSFFGGLGAASKQGILVKGSNYLEALAAPDTVVFDKTGTLTTGLFKVTQVNPIDISEEELLTIAAQAEYYSNHPIAASVKEAYKQMYLSKDRRDVDNNDFTEAFDTTVNMNASGKNKNTSDAIHTLDTDIEELAGYGIKAQIDGQTVYIGNDKLMESIKIEYEKELPSGTILHVAKQGEYKGYLVIADTLKEDAEQLITGLRSLGARKLVMLTGDIERVGREIGTRLGLDEVYAGLLPAGKVDKVNAMLADTQRKGSLIFVGDGMNDAPVLAASDVGVAMGGMGSAAAIEAADVVIMDDKPSKLVNAVGIGRKTLRIVKQNITFALAVKIGVLLLAALGMASMWAAVFADVGVSVIAILNAMRCLKGNGSNKNRHDTVSLGKNVTSPT